MIESGNQAPFARRLGFELSAVGEGWAEFTGVTSDDLYNPNGSVHGGFAAALLDSAMGCAIHTMLKDGAGYTTIELKINYIRAMFADTGRVTARGDVIHVGRRTATADGRLTDERGRLIAHGSTTCLIL